MYIQFIAFKADRGGSARQLWCSILRTFLILFNVQQDIGELSGSGGTNKIILNSLVPSAIYLNEYFDIACKEKFNSPPFETSRPTYARYASHSTLQYYICSTTKGIYTLVPLTGINEILWIQNCITRIWSDNSAFFPITAILLYVRDKTANSDGQYFHSCVQYS